MDTRLFFFDIDIVESFIVIFSKASKYLDCIC